MRIPQAEVQAIRSFGHHLSEELRHFIAEGDVVISKVAAITRLPPALHLPAAEALRTGRVKVSHLAEIPWKRRHYGADWTLRGFWEAEDLSWPEGLNDDGTPKG